MLKKKDDIPELQRDPEFYQGYTKLGRSILKN